MNGFSFVSNETKIYRMNWAYRLYHFATGAAALVCAIIAYHFLLLSVVLVLFSMFMIYRALVVAVAVDQSSVTLKGLFSQNSIQRSSITAIERQHTGRANYLVLWANIEKKEGLRISDIFAFDDAWDDWLSAYRDLSDDKPLSLF